MHQSLHQPPISIEEEEGEDNKIGWKKELPQGIVGEIVHLARNLPENLTLEEALDKGFEGRWMRSQEPSLITPRSCTVLFSALGQARMGDKLMVLFRNLPFTIESKMFMFIMLQFQAFWMVAGA
ncbi:hypothetical protein AHAS_Ahas05G0151600 [Arachis hypogaea]|uniref:Uncharacterized protein n=1 Tax=Arachis hypogaea TaxID=3818 RepID=A0A445D5Y6_ARAHY|nr:hypothetical protein Ahy_A05g024164 [Arachis hypogaea]